MSLRDAVGAKDPTDEFWVIVQDQDEPSETIKTVVAWLNDAGIYFETVSPAGGPVGQPYSKADEIHLARKPLDMMLRLTKGRLQPNEKSAILLLSDNLAEDRDAQYAIERATADDIPVYDLGGQMVQVQLEESEEITPPIPEATTITIPETAPQMEAVAEGVELRPHVNGDSSLEPVVTHATGPLTYTLLDLEDLTRDELKALVKTQGVTPSDMRSKDSMIQALMGVMGTPRQVPGEPYVTKTGKVLTDEDIQALADEAEQGYDVSQAVKYDEAEASAFEAFQIVAEIQSAYLLRVGSSGEVILQPIPPSKMMLIDTLLDGD